MYLEVPDELRHDPGRLHLAEAHHYLLHLLEHEGGVGPRDTGEARQIVEGHPYVAGPGAQR